MASAPPPPSWTVRFGVRPTRGACAAVSGAARAGASARASASAARGDVFDAGWLCSAGSLCPHPTALRRALVGLRRRFGFRGAPARTAPRRRSCLPQKLEASAPSGSASSQVRSAVGLCRQSCRRRRGMGVAQNSTEVSRVFNTRSEEPCARACAHVPWFGVARRHAPWPGLVSILVF